MVAEWSNVRRDSSQLLYGMRQVPDLNPRSGLRYRTAQPNPLNGLSQPIADTPSRSAA